MTVAARIDVPHDIVVEREESPSNWNYAIPVIATASWVGFWVSMACYLDYVVHDYKYPNNPINPDLVAMSKNAMISFGSIGGGMIPIAFGATILKACCLSVYSQTAAKICEVVRQSCSRDSFLKPEGILINTLAAPFAVLVALGYALGGCRS
jgi:hypothetical protein